MKPRQPRQAAWNEPIIMELGTPGERGVLLPEVEPEVAAIAGDVLGMLPDGVRRAAPPNLPEISQYSVLRHYVRLSQETMGNDVGVDMGKGTCTLKYSPKVQEHMARVPELTELHPLQAVETVQGLLQILYEFERMMKEISGMDRFSFQPGGGSQAIYANALIVRAYHESRGEFGPGKKDQVLTTIFSHPANAACPRTAGFEVVTLRPGPDGYPDLADVRRQVSERTAGLFITNPEDSGIFNPGIDDLVRVVKDAGGICVYDQANANGLLGITRAREAGFDLCHFNLHKTFSSPHGSGGPGSGASGATGELARYLPVPTVEYDAAGRRYWLNYDRPDSIGKVRQFHGAVQGVLRAYMWVLGLGAEGLKAVAETAVLNNNYLLKKMLEIRGVGIPYAHRRRIEQVRYSLRQLMDETGVSTHDVRARVTDFATHYWTSHHPFVVPEPATFEPTESSSKEDLDWYAAVIRQVCEEAYSEPDRVKTAPHQAPVHKVDASAFDDPDRWAMTWRAFLRKRGEPC
ncbi:MAG: aminomethyl-transferring glycine dehydrogenase subunit GcvPB [Bacillota bacterium]|nr:aminomethyl-transferring glycine dehydrogenase subunit GcvPB [Bacillota bacterium]